MTPLERIHDRLVDAEGYDCHCELWGSRCPAMQAALVKRKRELANEGQLAIGDRPNPGPMHGDDWKGF